MYMPIHIGRCLGRYVLPRYIGRYENAAVYGPLCIGRYVLVDMYRLLCMGRYLWAAM